MKSLLKLIVLNVAVVAGGLSSAATAAGAHGAVEPRIGWHAWAPGVFVEAERRHRLILLSLSAEWCEFCRKMKRITYRDPRVMEQIAAGYIAVMVDIEQLPELQARYPDIALPATLILDHKDQELMRRQGYINPQLMYWMLAAVRQDSLPKDPGP